jgi:hypothetical protein
MRFDGRPWTDIRSLRASFVYEGRLQVTDAEKFRVALHGGVGAEKAFGFGLIQIASVPAGSVTVRHREERRFIPIQGNTSLGASGE